MPRSDRQPEGYRIFIGGVDPRVGKVELEREFDRFGTITDVWVARNPPGFAFIVYKYLEDAEKAIRRMNKRLFSIIWIFISVVAHLGPGFALNMLQILWSTNKKGE